MNLDIQQEVNMNRRKFLGVMAATCMSESLFSPSPKPIRNLPQNPSDIFAPESSFQLSWQEKLITNSQPQSKFILDLVGNTNQNWFRGFPPSRILLVGVTGTKRVRDEFWELKYTFTTCQQFVNFAVSQNPIKITRIGPLYGERNFAKLGLGIKPDIKLLEILYGNTG